MLWEVRSPLRLAYSFYQDGGSDTSQGQRFKAHSSMFEEVSTKPVCLVIADEYCTCKVASSTEWLQLRVHQVVKTSKQLDFIKFHQNHLKVTHPCCWRNWKQGSAPQMDPSNAKQIYTGYADLTLKAPKERSGARACLHQSRWRRCWMHHLHHQSSCQMASVRPYCHILQLGCHWLYRTRYQGLEKQGHGLIAVVCMKRNTFILISLKLLSQVKLRAECLPEMLEATIDTKRTLLLPWSLLSY